jgi:ankyrin repeat protein
MHELKYMIFKALKHFFHTLHGGKTDLMIAVERESIDVIENMMSTCDSHEELFRIDHEGRTVLFYAAARGDRQIIWALLRRLPGTGIGCARGSLLNKKDNNGDLAEDVAETHGHEEAKHLLLHERIRIEYYE